MNDSSRLHAPAVRQTLQVGRGCLGRCQSCGGLGWLNDGREAAADLLVH
jgi:hypothetical protein